MGRIRKLLGLPPGQRWLLLKAVVLLAAVRLLLWLLPFPNVRRLINRASRRSRQLAADPVPVDRLAWAVEMASRFVPGGGHCLSKALAAQILLMRRGHRAEVRYGAVRQTTDDFVAHAWLESEGRAIIGGDSLNRYATLIPRANPPE
jgi:hypothetical protein